MGLTVEWGKVVGGKRKESDSRGRNELEGRSKVERLGEWISLN